MRSLAIIIFSKDRPAQLDLLLRSMRRFLPAGPAITARVLYLATTEAYARGYAQVQADHPGTACTAQRDFRQDVLALVQSPAPLLMFLVDDDVLVKDFSLDLAEVRAFESDPAVLTLSLRLNPQVTYCYTKDQALVPPALLPGGRWTWKGQPGDWGYPMSLDGHLFRAPDLVALIRSASFSTPNSLESALAERPLDAPLMACFRRSRLVNIPANRVQDAFPNRHMSCDPADLNRRFLAGSRIDLDPIIAAHRGDAVHQEIPFTFSAVPAGTPAPRGGDAAPATPPGTGQGPDDPAAQRLRALMAAGTRKLHLGCGANILPGFINIDVADPNRIQSRRQEPDIIADFTTLDCPPGSVEAIYAAHVFEHFQRARAIELMVSWNRWLAPGGTVCLEMPDIEACLAEFPTADGQRRKQLIRHLWGSHEASWATHHEGWMPSTAGEFLEAHGFAVEDVARSAGRWPAFRIVGRKRCDPDPAAIKECFRSMYPGDEGILTRLLAAAFPGA